MINLTRTASFSAAHRLNSPLLTPEQNHAVYGKCNRMHGHGHNYSVHCTVRGNIARDTGMVRMHR